MKQKFGLIIIIAILLGGGFSLVKISRKTTSSTNQHITVSTSFYPLYFFAKQIAGNNLNIVNITPAGSEPHDYEPTAQDIATIEKSRLLILQGSSLEAWGNKIKDTLSNQGVKIDTVGEAEMTQQYTDETGNSTKDPHTWLAPLLAKQEANKIKEDLSIIDPTHRQEYQTNGDNLAQRLDVLDSQYRQGLASCQNHDIITSHAAFGYLAHELGLTQIPIAGLSPDTEPNAHDMANIVQFAKTNKIHYIFFESLVSPKLAQTIASEIGAQTMVLNPIEGLTDEEIEQGHDYFTVMRDNLKALQTALQCK